MLGAPAKSRLNHLAQNRVRHSAWRNSINGENAVYATKQNCQSGTRCEPVLRSAAQIQTVVDREKRHEKADAAKDENGFEGLDVKQSF